ncbi:MAG: hypothetical protein U0350_50270 [Caldilineaceae bacterium]
MVAHWEGADNSLWRFRRLWACGQEAATKPFPDAGQASSRRQHEAQQLFAPLGLGAAFRFGRTGIRMLSPGVDL